MKVISFFLRIGCVMLATACSFSAGTNTDLSTGLSYRYTGFSVERVVLVDSENTVKTDNEVDLNSKVSIAAEGLTNYVVKDNKVNPGLMLLVTDRHGNAIINEADLFSESPGFTPEDAAFLRGTVTIGNPMKSGETYHVKIYVWDKNKPENELTAEIDLVVR